MWLPKNEKKLLNLYYKEIGEPGRQEFIGEDNLIKTLSPKCAAQGIVGVPEYAESKSRKVMISEENTTAGGYGANYGMQNT